MRSFVDFRESKSLLVVALLSLVLPGLRVLHAATLPTGFRETIVLSNLVEPTAVRFASDGRVFVAEKSGLVKVFASLQTSDSTVVVDLRTQVHNFWDRGLLGMALDPNFPANPYLYVLYTYDAIPGGAAPRWGSAGATSDGCPDPPGAASDGCVVGSRLSRIELSGNVAVGPEKVLVEGWCQQYPSHSTGTVAFGPDGALYASAGDGASFLGTDYGQFGGTRPGTPTVVNPCGDPPGGVGVAPVPPNARGGSLRSQSLRRPAGEPVVLGGTVIRVDAATGLGSADNAGAASTDINARRIVGFGLRNPFRMTFRPGTRELWIGDVGWSDREEINRLVDPTAPPSNFGWPCYEGPVRQYAFDGLDLALCESLYATPAAVVAPFHSYAHVDAVAPADGCPAGSSAIAGLAFRDTTTGNYPAEYAGALFFADNSRGCIWVMPKDASGLPSPALLRPFVTAASSPVDVQIGPGGDLFYVDLRGTVRRITYGDGAPAAEDKALRRPATASSTYADYVPALAVDGASGTRWSSQFADGQWWQVDLGSTRSIDSVLVDWEVAYASRYKIQTSVDGVAFTDAADQSIVATGPQMTRFAVRSARYVRVLCVTRATGYGISFWDVNVFGPADPPPGNTAPQPSITSPAPGVLWKVGDAISFTGSATDAEDGAVPATSLSWDLVIYHCPSNCHVHPVQSWTGVASGSFFAPDHEYPSYLELQLTATDSAGLKMTRNLRLDAQTTTVTMQSSPAGLALGLNSDTRAAPFSRDVIVGSSNTIAAPSPQTLNGTSYTFESWADGGAASRNITAQASSRTYTARFVPTPPRPLHVGDLDAVPQTLDKNSWSATMTILVHDQNHAAVPGASVRYTWSGGISGSATCVTGADGRCAASTGRIPKAKTSVTLTVSAITLTAYAYQATGNHDPEADSNGTTVSATKPP